MHVPVFSFIKSSQGLCPFSKITRVKVKVNYFIQGTSGAQRKKDIALCISDWYDYNVLTMGAWLERECLKVCLKRTDVGIVVLAWLVPGTLHEIWNGDHHQRSRVVTPCDPLIR